MKNPFHPRKLSVQIPFPRTVRLALHVGFSIMVAGGAAFYVARTLFTDGPYGYPRAVEERLLDQVSEYFGAIGAGLEANSPPHGMSPQLADPPQALKRLIEGYPHVKRAFHCTPEGRFTLVERKSGGFQVSRLDLTVWRSSQSLATFQPVPAEIRVRDYFIGRLLSGFAFRLNTEQFKAVHGMEDAYAKGDRRHGHVGYEVDTLALADDQFERVLQPSGLNGWIAPRRDYPMREADDQFRVTSKAFQRYSALQVEPTALGLSMTYLEVVQEAWKILGLLALLLLVGLMAAARELRGLMNERAVALAQSNFVSGVSHEMRTPLTTIKMYAEMMEQGIIEAPEKRGAYLKTIGQEADRLNRLVENVLDFSKVQADRRPLQPERFVLLDAVEEAKASVSALLSETGMAVETDISPFFEIVADRDALVQVLVNLMSNAAKYAADGKLVWVSAAEAEGGIRLVVKDFGPGIARQDIRKVFKPFYRGGNELTRNTKGTGLGLALVEAYIKAHDGTIRLESKPGEGTEFQIAIPQGGKRT